MFQPAKEPRKPLAKRTKIIIGVIVWIIALLITGIVTYIFVKSTTPAPESAEATALYARDPALAPNFTDSEVDYYSFIDSNAIKIEEKTETPPESVWSKYCDKTEYKKDGDCVVKKRGSEGLIDYGTYTSNYYQISGLTDKAVERKINNLLHSRVQKIHDSGYVASARLGLNFANVLSVVYQCDAVKTLEECDAVTVDLSDGHEIVFDELFVRDANIFSMVASSFVEGRIYGLAEDRHFTEVAALDEYEYLNSCAEEENTAARKKCVAKAKEHLKEIDQNMATAEEYALAAAKSYLSDGSTKAFYLAHDGIHIISPDLNASIPASRYSHKFAFYKRYLTENSIFENDTLSLHNLRLPDSSQNIYDEIYSDYRKDNLYIEAYYHGDDLGFNLLDKYLDKITDHFISDFDLDNKFNYFFFAANAYECKDEEEYGISCRDGEKYDAYFYDVMLCSMDKSYFENKMQYNIFDAFADPAPSGGVYVSLYDYLNYDKRQATCFPPASFSKHNYSQIEAYFDEKGNFVYEPDYEEDDDDDEEEDEEEDGEEDTEDSND